MSLDTRDLIEERENLKQDIFEDFIGNFPQYDDMTESFENIRFEEEEIESWKDGWYIELEVIKAIDELENEISSSEWDYGLFLVEEDDFQEYCKDLVNSIGDLPKDLPAYISNNIDWRGVAEDLKGDYSEVNFKGVIYLYR